MTRIERSASIDSLPNLMRVSEVAVFLDCGEGTVRAMVRAGQLTSVRLGRLLRIPRCSIAEWLRVDVPGADLGAAERDAALAFVRANPRATSDEILAAVRGRR